MFIFLLSLFIGTGIPSEEVRAPKVFTYKRSGRSIRPLDTEFNPQFTRSVPIPSRRMLDK